MWIGLSSSFLVPSHRLFFIRNGDNMYFLTARTIHWGYYCVPHLYCNLLSCSAIISRTGQCHMQRQWHLGSSTSLGIKYVWEQKQCLPRHSTPACCKYPLPISTEFRKILIWFRTSFFYQRALYSLQVEHKLERTETYIEHSTFCADDYFKNPGELHPCSSRLRRAYSHTI